MQREHALAFALPGDKEARRLERGAQLAGDGLEQADLLRGPRARLADLVEQEDARRLHADADRGRDARDGASLDELVAPERGLRQPKVRPRVAHRDGPALPRRERCHRRATPRPDADRVDPRSVPLVQDRDVGARIG